ncbi:restriction endonuclease subunit S [Paenibacillus lautus]|uniref:restriction endonuclease subunit S n=1 Tax=Paenibacillus lautus TaxID=1401 RepID=UPI001C12285C|nr:restriction endonuclease subunit S [Paenibacillus lautus]MBU5349151.1 restriction endonuclease subunit S [Paenibacillus lautus]
MSYRVVSLNEIADINPKTDTRHLSDDSLVTVLPMSSVSEEGIIKEHQISTLTNIKKGLTLFKENDVLLAKITPCMENGKRAIAKELQNGIGFGSTEFHVIRAKQEVLPEFVYYFISQNSFRKEAELNMTGSAGQKRVPSSFLKTVKVSLPPIEEQNKIVSALAEADALLQKRKTAIAKLDALLKSYFIFNVGPKHIDYDKWNELCIEELAAQYKGSMRTGPFGSDLRHSEFVEDGIAVLGIDNAVKNHFAWGERRFITEEKYEKLKRYTVKPGDVIITIMGTTGRSAVVPEDISIAITTKHLATITVNRDMTFPEFLSFSIHSHPDILHQIKLANKGAIMDGLNLGIIKGLKLKVPPIDKQEKFIKYYHEIQLQRCLMESQLIKLEENFRSLLHQAFTGRLQFRDSKVNEYALKR